MDFKLLAYAGLIALATPIIIRLLRKQSAMDKMAGIGGSHGILLSNLLVVHLKMWENLIENIIIAFWDLVKIYGSSFIIGLRKNNQQKAKVRDIKTVGKQRIDLIKHQGISNAPVIDKYLKKYEIRKEKKNTKKKIFDVMRGQFINEKF